MLELRLNKNILLLLSGYVITALRNSLIKTRWLIIVGHNLYVLDTLECPLNYITEII